MEFQLCLVSNLATPYKESIRRLGLDDYIDQAIYSCDVGCMKPEKEIFEIALKKLGVKPEEAVMIGDDENADVFGAKTAGVKGFLIEAETVSGNPKVVPSIADVPALFSI